MNVAMKMKTAKRSKTKKNKKMKTEFISSIIISIVMIIIGMMILQGMDRQDRITCNKLQQQSKDYPTFYSTESEKEMCRAFGITLEK